MAVTYMRKARNNLDEISKHFIGPIPEKCSYCLRHLEDSDIAVYWNIFGNCNVWFHSKCAESFALKLLFDAQRAKVINNNHCLDSGIHDAPIRLYNEVPIHMIKKRNES